MKIDLCKLFGVEEGEEFRIGTYGNPYRVYNNSLQHFDTYSESWNESVIEFNYVISSNIIKLPKKKQFTDDELCILRNIDKEWKWIARDERDKIDDYDYYVNGYDDGYEFGLMLYKDKPCKCIGWETDDDVESLNVYSNLFNSIQWEDEEPVFIDDYVERGAE